MDLCESCLKNINNKQEGLDSGIEEVGRRWSFRRRVGWWTLARDGAADRLWFYLGMSGTQEGLGFWSNLNKRCGTSASTWFLQNSLSSILMLCNNT